METSDSLPTSHDASRGRVLRQRFRLDNVIGEGAMGAVYRAWDLQADRACAVKMLRPDTIRNPGAAARFCDEARIIAHLYHPHIVEMIEFGEERDGALFLAMELLSGMDLHTFLMREPHIPLPRALELVRQIGSALTLEGYRPAPAAAWTAARVATLLGTLVGTLLGSYVTTDQVEAASESDARDDIISFKVKMNLRMSVEDYDRTQNELKELVLLRNNLVHHFIDQHDLWSLDGCRGAHDTLKAAYSRIDQHFEQLRGWAEHMDQARRLAAEFVQSDVFHDLVVNGIAPDGTVDWPAAGIVRALR